MDPSLGFAQLLGIASYNQKDRTTNDKNKLLKTKIGNAKKEKRDKGKLSANVQKFLQKQEQEEKRKKLEAISLGYNKIFSSLLLYSSLVLIVGISSR